MNAGSECEEREHMPRAVDVLVCGGGPAGVVAATQSAAAGARTLLVERGSMLGGTTTAAGINFPGLFHAWGRQVVAGYGWQLVQRCVTEAGGQMPDFSAAPEHHWQHQVRVDRPLYTMLCDEMVAAAGGQVLFHAMPARLEPRCDGWAVTLCGKAGLVDIDAGCVVDCTGDANLVGLAGGELRRAGSASQPGTYSCRAAGYDVGSLDMAAINRAFAEAVTCGELSPYDIGWSSRADDVGSWLRQGGQNANHIPGIDAGDSLGRSRMELAGRRSILRLVRFLRRQTGLENLRLDYLAAECGVRETARIVGDVTITVEDYVSGRLWEDALCYAFYPVDLHTADNRGLDKRTLAPGIVPTVPRGALLPRGLSRIAAAGRCVSSDRFANSALRVQAASMAMGQAAGAMAALSVKHRCDCRDLGLEDIRRLLRRHGAVVPGEEEEEERGMRDEG